MTLKEAEVLALSTLKQVMEEKVSTACFPQRSIGVLQAKLPIRAGLV